MAVAIVCWRCEQPGHIAAECTPPPAKTETELKARFARYMELRIAGRISTATKRAWVTSEWKAFNDRKAKEKAK
jgi:hypothetical protein